MERVYEISGSHGYEYELGNELASNYIWFKIIQ